MHTYVTHTCSLHTHSCTHVQVDTDDLPVIVRTEHDLTVRNEMMVLNPPIERARENLISQLQAFIAVVTDLPRIQASKYVLGVDSSETAKSKLTYRSLLSSLSHGDADLRKVYQEIEKVMSKANEYVFSLVLLPCTTSPH